MILLTVPCKLSLVVFLKTLGNVFFMMQLSKCNVPLSFFSPTHAHRPFFIGKTWPIALSHGQDVVPFEICIPFEFQQQVHQSSILFDFEYDLKKYYDVQLILVIDYWGFNVETRLLGCSHHLLIVSIRVNKLGNTPNQHILQTWHLSPIWETHTT